MTTTSGAQQQARSHGSAWFQRSKKPPVTQGPLVALSQHTPNTTVELRPPAARLKGRPPVTRRRITKRDRRRVAELYQSGRSIRYVASEVGIGRATVLDILKQFGIERRPVGLHY